MVDAHQEHQDEQRDGRDGVDPDAHQEVGHGRAGEAGVSRKTGFSLPRPPDTRRARRGPSSRNSAAMTSAKIRLLPTWTRIPVTVAQDADEHVGRDQVAQGAGSAGSS